MYKELAPHYGWVEVESKNPKMISFVKDDVRMNIYFTTGTITFQEKPTIGGYGTTLSYKNILDDQEFEKLLLKYEALSSSTDDTE
ncbi:MAG: hypothetical protein EBR82_14495 [Caulobacteraceae bacterium]|nr:hypothetical protein [Caulobacteraceae bacterium]